MSYILEALKKAQAERQLGSSPTIHAPTLQSAEREAAGARKAPMVLALLGMAAVIGVLLTLVLRTSEPVAPAAVPQAAVSRPSGDDSGAVPASLSAAIGAAVASDKREPWTPSAELTLSSR